MACVSVVRAIGPIEETPTSLIVPSPTETPFPPITPLATETPFPPITPSPIETPSVQITHPQDGAQVQLETAVMGNYSGLQPDQAPYLYVVVKPRPEDPNIPWFVQEPTVPNADGTWQVLAYIGLPEDAPGTPFQICAVVSSELLSPNQQLPSPPQGPSHCISVTRGP